MKSFHENMEQSLSDKLKEFGWKVGDCLKTGAKATITLVVGGFVLYTLASSNGCLDSLRTKETRQYSNQKNPIKIVKGIEEEWKDNSAFALASSAIGGCGYNPRVIRKITFEDGTQTILDYRVLAWQPFMRWKNGEEFNPKVGEKYEVEKEYNTLLRKLE